MKSWDSERRAGELVDSIEDGQGWWVRKEVPGQTGWIRVCEAGEKNQQCNEKCAEVALTTLSEVRRWIF